MKSTIETLSPTRVRLEVEVPFAELEPDVKKAYRAIGAQVSVPGFRKGKVPAAVIDRRVGRNAVLEEAVHSVLPQRLDAAVKEHEVKTLGQPVINISEIVDGEPVRFTAEVDIRPELTFPDFSSIEVPVVMAEVTDEEIDEQVLSLRQRFANLKSVERPTAHGDYVQIDLAATVDGQEVRGGSATNISHEVGSGQLVPGLDEVLVGMSAGESTTFQTTLVGGDFAGRDADVAITVKVVKEKQLPELDDDFAQMASEFDTLDEVVADLRKRLEVSKKLDLLLGVRDKTIEALVDAMDIPTPEGVVNEEMQQRKQSMIEHFEKMGVSLDDYLAIESRTEESLDQELMEAATMATKIQLALEALAESESVTVTQEEFGEEILERANESGKAPQQYYEDLVRSGKAAAIYTSLIRSKALTLLMGRVRLVDVEGNTVMLESLREGLLEAKGRYDDHSQS